MRSLWAWVLYCRAIRKAENKILKGVGKDISTLDRRPDVKAAVNLIMADRSQRLNRWTQLATVWALVASLIAIIVTVVTSR